MTLTEDRPAEHAPASSRPDEARGGVGFVWFVGSFVVALHLVVLVGLGILATRSDGLDTRRAANDPVAPTAEVVFVATEFAYDPTDAQVEPGLLTVTMRNEGAIFHNLVIEGVPGFVVEADGGDTGSAGIELADGVYTIFCSVPGHREAGMEGTLTAASS